MFQIGDKVKVLDPHSAYVGCIAEVTCEPRQWPNGITTLYVEIKKPGCSTGFVLRSNEARRVEDL